MMEVIQSMSRGTDINYAAFSDCLSVAIIEKSGALCAPKVQKVSIRSSSKTSPKLAKVGLKDTVSEGSDPAELGEFVQYIAEETFYALPSALRTLTYEAVQNDGNLAEKYAIPVSSELMDDLANMVPSGVEETLQTYRLISPPATDLASFLTTTINTYIVAVTTSPPQPLATRKSACEICMRDWIPLTYHHLIPRAVHAKVLKRNWHPESALNSVAWLCRACHSFVHHMAGNEELAREWWTVELILSRDDVQAWAKWVGRVRWKKR